MNRKFAPIARVLILALLLCLLGMALLATHAAPLEESYSYELAARDQACYTLDTTRPEWLEAPSVIYLPLIMKNHAP